MKTCEGCKYAEGNHKDAPCSIIGSYPKALDNCGRELKAKLEKLVEQGTKDWADVPNVTKWVEEQRGIEQEGVVMTPEQEEHRHIQELCRIKGKLGRTGRYGVYFDLTGPEIEFWVEEFGKPDFLLHIKHQDAGAVLDCVRKRCDELNLLSTP